MDNDYAALMNRMLFYARRAGYLEGAMWIIAQGASKVDPKVAAQRALDAVGPDILAQSQPIPPSAPLELQKDAGSAQA